MVAEVKPSTINVPVSVIGLEQLGILGEIVAERRRQDEKFGDLHKQELIDSEVSLGYDAILLEEVYEAIEESWGGERERLRTELVQVAAVAVAWIESIDKRAKETS